MKSLRTSVLCAAIALSGITVHAQEKTVPPVNEPDYNRPKLFDGMPDNIRISAETISNLFDMPLGRSASITLTEDSHFRFNGEVVSSGNKSQHVQSIVIRSTNFNGAILSASRISHPDGTVSYRARIISYKHGDLYLLENQNGQYILVKKNFYDLVNE